MERLVVSSEGANSLLIKAIEVGFESRKLWCKEYVYTVTISLHNVLYVEEFHLQKLAPLCLSD